MNYRTGVAPIVGMAFLLTACSGGSDPTAAEAPTAPREPTPEDQLATPRFTTHQPGVLEQIGAHHAYALGLSGQGVRIGIEDTIVDYTQRAEFGSRVKLQEADGAALTYVHPFGDDRFSDVQRCRRAGTCSVWSGNSEGDDEALNRWARDIISEDGWPERDDSAFVLDEHFNAGDPIERLSRWWEVPTPYGPDHQHGTVVASVAAGANFGVAPSATIIPVVTDFSDDQEEVARADAALRFAVSLLPEANRRQFDDLQAAYVEADYAKFDIINRSFGMPIFDPDVVSSTVEAELQWYRRYLPNTLDALLQVDTPDSRKTIIVYAAGNHGEIWSDLGADLPFYISELRGHSLSVVATDPSTGIIADYSNRCGSLPLDWDAATHGRHYCLAAPGTVRGLVPNPATPGQGDHVGGLEGTSFAAPMVSGSLALLKEHFRGTRGNTEIVKRMIDTADRSGQYGDLETYGAGHLDLAAALLPVGSLSAGQSAQPLSRTVLYTPAAFGSVVERIGGIELTAFDNHDFPFWVPLSDLVSTVPEGRSPIPEFAETERTGTPAVGLGTLGQKWAAVESMEGLPLLPKGEWMMGFGPASASLARRPQAGGWGYGFSVDRAGYMDSQTSGAFGAALRSGMVWVSRTIAREIGGGFTVNAGGTLAYSIPQYEANTLFSASASLMSTLAMRIGTPTTGLTVEQPLRAETGTGTFRIENGQIEDGRRLYEEYRIPLRPDAREVRLAFRHEREALGGSVAVEVGHSMQARHAPDHAESGVGVAYRMTW